MKKPETSNKKTSTNQEPIKVESFKVLKTAMIGENNNVTFDLELNGIRIYGCFVVEGKDGDFISLPQRQGKNGKYYSIVWARFSDEDQKDILAEVEKALAAN